MGSNPCIRKRFDDDPKTFCANTAAIKVVRGLFTSGHNVRDSILNYEAKTQTGKSLSAIGSFFKSKASALLLFDTTRLNLGVARINADGFTKFT